MAHLTLTRKAPDRPDGPNLKCFLRQAATHVTILPDLALFVDLLSFLRVGFNVVRHGALL